MALIEELEKNKAERDKMIEELMQIITELEKKLQTATEQNKRFI